MNEWKVYRKTVKEKHLNRKSKILKISVTGPESTGKTTLAKALAAHYNTVWVPEYARNYLEKLGRPYAESDLLSIAEGQMRLEQSLAKNARHVLFCDTDLLVIQIWSAWKYGKVHPWIREMTAQSDYHLHLLCGTEVPWEPDPLRENPEEREELYGLYLQELTRLNKPFVEVKGGIEERMSQLIPLLDESLSLNR